MTYEVKFLPRALDALRHLDRIVAQRIDRKIQWLAENVEYLTHETLTGDEWRGLFKLRVGDYRILFTISQPDRLIVIRYIGHRRDAYKAK